MGLGPSAYEKEKEEGLASLPRVVNQDQFVTRVRQLIRRQGQLDVSYGPNLTDGRELARLTAIWAKFAKSRENSTTTEGEEVWDAQSLESFLNAAYPNEAHAAVAGAAPILYRLILRLGSFPYHMSVGQMLTLDITAVAITILLGRSELWHTDPDYCDQPDPAETLWLRRILFQCMSVQRTRLPISDVVPRPTARTDVDDDEDLLKAHEIVNRANRVRMWETAPKMMVRGPPIIEASALPSSQSADIQGRIPKHGFRALVRLIVVGDRWSRRRTPEALVSQDQEELDRVVERVWMAFESEQPEIESVPDYSWDTFRKGVELAEPHGFDFCSGLSRLFEPFVAPNDIEPAVITASTRAEAVEIMRYAMSKEE